MQGQGTRVRPFALLTGITVFLRDRSPYRLVVDAIVLFVLAALAEMLTQRSGAAMLTSPDLRMSMMSGGSPSLSMFWPMLWFFAHKTLFWTACVLAALGCVQLVGAARSE
jgi:hypothetical protein